MSKNNNAKQTRGVTLRDPKDARRIVKSLVDTAFREGLEMEYFGKIVNGLTCWAKLWELEKVSDIERRFNDLGRAVIPTPPDAIFIRPRLKTSNAILGTLSPQVHDYFRGGDPPQARCLRARSGSPGIFFVGNSFYTVGYVT